LPQTIIKRIEVLCRNFLFWGGVVAIKSIVPLQLGKLFRDKKKAGGLHIKSYG